MNLLITFVYTQTEKVVVWKKRCWIYFVRACTVEPHHHPIIFCVEKTLLVAVCPHKYGALKIIVHHHTRNILCAEKHIWL